MPQHVIHCDVSNPGERARYPHVVKGWHGIMSNPDWGRVTCKSCLRVRPQAPMPAPSPVAPAWVDY